MACRQRPPANPPRDNSRKNKECTQILFENSSNLKLIRDMIAAWCSEANFSQFMYRLCHDSSGFGRKIALVHNYNEDWQRYYREHHQYRIDPIVRYCQAHSEPIFWDEMTCPADVPPEKYDQFIRNACASGIRHGVSFPIHGPFGEWGILSLNCEKPLHRKNSNSEQLIASGRMLCSQIQSETRKELDFGLQQSRYYDLTRREKECLIWSIEGKTSWEISIILEISERTVVYHINNCIAKLDVLNRTQAVALAYPYLQADISFMREGLYTTL